MRFYDQPASTVVVALTTAASAACDAANLVRMMSVRGSHRRYLAATVVHLTIYPSIMSVLLLAAKDLAEHDYIKFGWMLGLSTIWAWAIVTFQRDDDDDWFNSRGPKRLLDRLTSRGRRAAAAD